jgi:hypothetical protein
MANDKERSFGFGHENRNNRPVGTAYRSAPTSRALP